MKHRRSGTDSKGDNKSEEGSEWEKRDRSVLAPVASGTVDTGERVGIDWWGIAWLTLTAHLTLSSICPTHHMIYIRLIVSSNSVVKTTSFFDARILTRAERIACRIGHTKTLRKFHIVLTIVAIDKVRHLVVNTNTVSSGIFSLLPDWARPIDHDVSSSKKQLSTHRRRAKNKYDNDKNIHLSHYLSKSI